MYSEMLLFLHIFEYIAQFQHQRAIFIDSFQQLFYHRYYVLDVEVHRHT